MIATNEPGSSQRGTTTTRQVSSLSDEPGFLLAVLPPTSRQNWSALGVAAVLVVGSVAIAPFASTPLERLDAFIPSVQSIVLVTDIITSVLLFTYFSISHSRALLALASGYLFTALIVIPHSLTFPGAFSQTGLLGAGLQSTAWLYIFWHVGFPTSLLMYASLKDQKPAEPVTQASTLAAIGWSVAIVSGLVCGLTWLAIAGDRFLPRLVAPDRVHASPLLSYFVACMALICVTALAVLWVRRRSVLDQWVTVVSLALISELAFTSLLSNARFSFGFYAGRVLSVVTSTIVLVVLLAETTRLYAGVARTNMALQRERKNKLMNLEAMAASISHEVRQPLMAITMNGGAALRFLGHTPPNLDEARSSLNMIVSDGHRASEVFDSLRALFGKDDPGQDIVDVNEVVAGALHTLRGELSDREIITRVELTPDLPLVVGNKAQLHEVMINLAHNAADAMEEVKDDRRMLRVRTEHQGDVITVVVENSGPGIDPEKLDRIFDAFVTTKAHGMGLGLAICRMIIDRHAGELSASPAHPHGTVFRIALPKMKLPH